MAGIDLRPRTGNEIIDVAFDLVRSNFALLVGAMALAQLPGALFSIAFPSSPTDPFAGWREHPIIYTAAVLVGVWWWMVTTFAFIRIVADIVHGRPTSLAGRLRDSIPLGLQGTVLAIVSYVVFVLWALLLLVPAIFALARYFASGTAMALEGLGPFAAIRRSKQLAKGSIMRVIGIAILPLLVYLIVVMVLQQTLLAMGRSMLVLQLASALVSCIVAPFAMTPGVLLYFDQRVRREGLDIELASAEQSAA